jgi:hypothetical protein
LRHTRTYISQRAAVKREEPGSNQVRPGWTDAGAEKVEIEAPATYNPAD